MDWVDLAIRRAELQEFALWAQGEPWRSPTAARAAFYNPAVIDCRAPRAPAPKPERRLTRACTVCGRSFTQTYERRPYQRCPACRAAGRHARRSWAERFADATPEQRERMLHAPIVREPWACLGCGTRMERESLDGLCAECAT
jgi:hypothetical protein